LRRQAATIGENLSISVRNVASARPSSRCGLGALRKLRLSPGLKWRQAAFFFALYIGSLELLREKAFHGQLRILWKIRLDEVAGISKSLGRPWSSGSVEVAEHLK